MKVKITKRGGYGDRNGVLHPERSVVDFPDDLARKLVMHRFAVPAPDEIETAMVTPKRNAAKLRPKSRVKGPVTTKSFHGQTEDE